MAPFEPSCLHFERRRLHGERPHPCMTQFWAPTAPELSVTLMWFRIRIQPFKIMRIYAYLHVHLCSFWYKLVRYGTYLNSTEFWQVVILTTGMFLQIARKTGGRTGQSGLREAEMRRGPCGWIASSGEQAKGVLCQLRLQVFLFYGTLPSAWLVPVPRAKYRHICNKVPV